MDRFEEVCRVLPPRLRTPVLEWNGIARTEAEELRLKMGQPLLLRYGGGRERFLHSEEAVNGRDISLVMENATKGSLHAALETIRNGFVSVEGGHRLGVCGFALMQNGSLCNMRDISSVCIRIAREHKGVALPLLTKILSNDRLENTLIVSPPGAGKTTLLRDLIRVLSNGEGTVPRRVSVADERGELCGSVGGLPQMDVGLRTDVWTGLPKAEAAVMLLRGLSPQVLAMDEITASEDIAAAEMCFGCGVSLLATAHAAGIGDLFSRPIYQSLHKIFTRMVVITLSNGRREYRVETIGTQNITEETEASLCG